MKTQNEILGHFQKTKRIRSNSWQAICPCHNDKKQSLTITFNDKCLIHCHAGCRTEDILKSVGLTFADISNKASVEEKAPEWMNGLIAEYKYYEPYTKKYLFSKLRYSDQEAGKRITYARTNGKQFKSGKGDAKATLYNINDLINANGKPVYYVEGEKDVETLKRLGYIAVTAGSASDWRKEYAPYFKGARLTIFADNDEPGKKLANKVQRDVMPYAYCTRIIIPSVEEHGDITDYLTAVHNQHKAFAQLLDETAYPYQFAQWISNGKINADLLAATFCNTNYMLTANSKARSNNILFLYAEGHYKQISRNELEKEIRRYIPIGHATASLLRNTADLIITSATSIDFDAFNSNENIINVRNGLYDIRQKKLLKHTPDELSSIQLKLEYDTKASCPKWMRFIDDLCLDEEGNIDNEMKLFLQEYAGLILSNVYGHKLKGCLILYSAEGNTGKSVFINVLANILGAENIANVSFQRMSEDRFATADLFGKRLDLVADQASNDLKCSSVFKQLTSGDIINAEFKGIQGFTFTFKGVILVACNILPAFQDDKGNHISKRMNIANCRNVIPEEKQNKNLVQELTAEASGIFLWALEGLHRLIDNKYQLTPCASGNSIKEDYRKLIDNLYAFINDASECIVDVNAQVKKTSFESAYLDYCERNNYTPINKKNIPNRMKSIGYKLKMLHGYSYYAGINIR